MISSIHLLPSIRDTTTERGFAIREKLPNRNPPPPPPPPPLPTTPPPVTPQNRNVIETQADVSSNKFFSSSVSPVLRRRIWQASNTTSMANHVQGYPFMSPPPLPVRRPDLPSRPYGASTPEILTKDLGTPPPLPPRQSIIDAEVVDHKNRINAETTHKSNKSNFNKNKLPSTPTTKKKAKSSQSFWKNLTTKQNKQVSKQKLSNKTTPPPLPPRHSTDVTMLQAVYQKDPTYEAAPAVEQIELSMPMPPPPPMGKTLSQSA